MGFHNEEDCPDVYYCEQCHPELHLALLRSLGLLPPASPPSAISATSISSSGRARRTVAGAAAEKAKKERELKAAREAVKNLALANAQRQKKGIQPVMGGDYTSAQATSQTQGGAQNYHSNGNNHQHDDDDEGDGGDVDDGNRNRRERNTSSSTTSNALLKSPKRRSTMNSRDSAYGWEPIPEGLLNEDEKGKWMEEEDQAGVTTTGRGGKKRKREKAGKGTK